MMRYKALGALLSIGCILWIGCSELRSELELMVEPGKSTYEIDLDSM